MPVTTDIVRTYRAPREVLRGKLAGGPREDRALATLLGACVLIFVAQWPVAAREAWIDPAVPLDARLGGALLAWVFIVPLASYVIAAATHVLARLFGGRGTWFGARLALFWALLAASPLWLLNGLVAGLVGPGPALSLTGLAAFAAFLVFWGAGLWEAEAGKGDVTP
jgi:hypothetical protein